MEGGPQDNGLSSSGSNSGSGGGAHGNHPVTSLVTTGPDGSLIDEASQQSTLSNASAGECGVGIIYVGPFANISHLCSVSR